MKNKPVLLLGGGGHAMVLLNILRLLDIEIKGYVSPQKSELEPFIGLSHFANDEDVLTFKPQEILLVNGLGSLPGASLRQKLYQQFKSKGYQFKTLVHPQACIAENVRLAQGVQIMAGVVVNDLSEIGENCIINTSASIDHECKIGDNVHIAPGVTLSGGVCIDADVHIGTGATIIQCIKVGQASVVGAGAVVTKDVPVKSIVYPARSETIASYRTEDKK